MKRYQGYALADVLETNSESSRPQLSNYRTTSERSVSRRGVIWLGQTCNLRCEFCYFITRIEDKAHPEHRFMPLEKAKEICDVLRNTYGNTSVDIEGGEPTIYPAIFDLLRHCVAIRLYPTLITNALVLADVHRCQQFKDAGVRDFKISIHGIGEVHDKLVRRRGAHELQLKAIANMRKLGIPFRFNTVLTPEAIPQLPSIAKLAVDTGALCVNWLGYNPHEDQESSKTRKALIPNFTLMRGPLAEALDILDRAGVESNVRYVPHCMVDDRHRKNIYHFQQLFYDHREWDLASWSWTTLQPQRETTSEISAPISLASLNWWVRLCVPAHAVATGFIARWFSIKRLVNVAWLLSLLYKFQSLVNLVTPRFKNHSKEELYDRVAKLHSLLDCESVHPAPCQACSVKAICSGIYKDYTSIFGTKEIYPIEGDLPINDPLHYIRHQQKLVEKEDESWALSREGE